MNDLSPDLAATRHAVTRHRHELRRRRLVVSSVEQVSPVMRRLILAGDDLDGFTSLSPDDHVKIFVTDEGGAVARRDYTPRHYDPVARRLTIDFAIHEAGPVTGWAVGAQVGDAVEIGGPRGSVVVPTDFDWWLLIGDETALPAIGRRIEELPAGTPATSIVAVPGAADEQRFETAAAHCPMWVHRSAASASDPAPLLAALSAFAPPAGDGFIWIAAEAAVARAVRTYVLEELRHPAAWTKASGYWTAGRADAAEKY